MNNSKTMTTLEKVAAGVSIAVIAAFLVYWGIQIQGAIEMLRLAGEL